MVQIKKSTYTHRYLAKIVLLAETPLAVGSGEKDITTDAMVIRDANGLPYIPGTALAGVLRHALGKENSKMIFGYQAPDKKKDGKGSEIIFTEARMIGKTRKVIDGLQDLDFNDSFYKHFKTLPVRQHVRITAGGAATDTGKFDEQIVFKGSRFCFEIEMVSNGSNRTVFENVLAELGKDTFRLGGGTRKGFGEMRIISCRTAELDLTKSEDLEAYLHKSSDLSHDWDRYTDFPIKSQQSWTTYILTLKPDNFFLFGSGLGNDKADITPVEGTSIHWEKDTPSFVTHQILIPASSVKGALSHRVAYHYNLLKQYFAGNPEAATGSANKAISLLFGQEDPKHPKRGNVIFSDVMQSPGQTMRTPVLDHVSIDRFTGGAIAGALFKEQVVYENQQEFTLKISVNTAIAEKSDVLTAFENALKDLCNGTLPLGGGTNRGNGCFTGKMTKKTTTYGDNH